MRNVTFLILFIMIASNVRAEIVCKTVEYKEGDTVLEGVSVYDAAIQGKRPAVLVVHQWMGLGDYEKKRAEMLARLGYNVFAADIYGKGIRPHTPTEAAAKVLALHGADDPNVPPKEVAAFEEEMRQAGVDWQLIAYGGAVHSFTDWNAGHDNSRGAAYNERADRRSWEAMKQFFAEVFQ